MKCDLCRLSSQCKNPRQLGNGSKSSKVMIVQENPYEFENRKKEYMGGKAGRLFQMALTEVGIDVDDVYYTAVVKCTTPEDRLPVPDEVRACADYLWAEIEVVNPDIIVPTGPLSLKLLAGLTGVTKHRGKLVEKDGLKIFPIVHPNMVLKQPKYMESFTQDMVNLRALLNGEAPEDIESFDKEYVYGDTFEVASKELMRFIQLPSGCDVVLDLETIKSNPYLEKVSLSEKATALYEDGICRPSIIGVGLSDREGYGFAFPLHHRETPFETYEIGTLIKLLRALLSRDDLNFTAHNGKFDMKWLRNVLHCEVGNFKWDTMLIHYIAVTEEKGTHGLKDLAWIETDMGGYDNEMDSYKPKGKDEGNYDLIPWEILKVYLCGDVDCTMRILKKYKKLLEENPKLGWLWEHLLLPANQALMDIEHDGIQVDVDWLEKLEGSYPKEISRIEDKLKQFPEVVDVEREYRQKWEERLRLKSIPKSQRTTEEHRNFEIYKKFDPSKGGDKINFGSTAQLQDLLFNRMGLETDVLTDKGKPSTNDDSLKYMKKQHPVCATLLEHRKVNHLYNNFVVNMRAMLDPNNRVHGSYHIHGTVTGRLSSSEPNCQQFPRHSYNPMLFQYHNEIKNLFISRWGKEKGVILQFDYSQLELRILGVITGDPELIRLYKEGADLHKEVAASAFGIPIEEVTKDQRTAAKKIQYFA